MNNLYLASSSQSRQQLLTDAGFSFEILQTSSEPEPFDATASIEHNVTAAAAFKAKTAVLPTTANSAPSIFVITADTLIADIAGNIMRKPENLAHAHKQLRQLRTGKCTIATAAVIKKFDRLPHGGWKIVESELIYSESFAEFYVPDEQFDAYFSRLPIALHACGSGIIEGFGAQFLKTFQGSYSGALGLPIFEVAQALKKLGYK